MVIEVSDIIPRKIDRHISLTGICCIDIHHKLLYMSKKGINIYNFIRDKVYPYFANQLYYREKNIYAGNEYKHHFLGTVQFYFEDLNIKSPQLAVTILDSILLNNLPVITDQCICGSKKNFLSCHSQSVDYLKTLGQYQLREDIKEFRNILAANY